jgi:hypothetical protein
MSQELAFQIKLMPSQVSHKVASTTRFKVCSSDLESASTESRCGSQLDPNLLKPRVAIQCVAQPPQKPGPASGVEVREECLNMRCKRNGVHHQRSREALHRAGEPRSACNPSDELCVMPLKDERALYRIPVK